MSLVAAVTTFQCALPVNPEEACIFDKYCRMAEKLSDDSRKDFIRL